jgi:hypothetical protein
MSPTSYQTAPPRKGIIAEAEWFVKRMGQRIQHLRLGASSENSIARTRAFRQFAENMDGASL